MTNVLKKHMSLFSILALLVALWQFPKTAQVILVTFLLTNITVVFSLIFKKHREFYREGKITQVVLVRNIFLEAVGILLAVSLAGLAGRHLAQVATVEIANDLAKLIASIVIGLFAGAGIGLLVKKTWGRLIKA